MAKNIEFDFSALDNLQDMLKELDGNVDVAIDHALIDSQKYIAGKAAKAMEKHKRTGLTADSIVQDREVHEKGGYKDIDVGFRIRAGGLPSIFLMYGTTLYGQPHIKPDKELYDAVFGSKTRRDIEEIQEQAFRQAIEEAMK